MEVLQVTMNREPGSSKMMGAKPLAYAAWNKQREREREENGLSNATRF